MPLYTYQKQDGQYIELWFHMNEVPQQVILEDGTSAKKQITAPYLQGTPQSKERIKIEQTKKNIDAGNRGRTYWSNKFNGGK